MQVFAVVHGWYIMYSVKYGDGGGDVAGLRFHGKKEQMLIDCVP